MSTHEEEHKEVMGLTSQEVAAAHAAASKEHAMTFKEALPRYWRGMLWSAMLSLALVMEGYDVSMINSYFGHPAFKERFGEYNAQGEKVIPADWQSGLGNISSVGTVIGLMLNGWAQYKFGSKRVYLCAMVLMAAVIFIPVFSVSLPMLLIGVFLCGIPWGVFQTLTTTYAAELMPMALRPYLTSFVNICWAAGLFLGSGIVRATLNIEGNLSWRLPYMIQWVWPVPLFIACLFAPESPWYLVRVGKIDEARNAVAKTCTPGLVTQEEIDATVSLMQHTTMLELQESKQQSLTNCFKGTNLRRTEIVCVVWVIQNMCGQQLTSYATEFLQEVGLNSDQSFDINIGSVGMLFVGTMLVWVGMSRFGRRQVYIGGQVALGVILLVMGILGCIPAKNVSYGIGALLMLINFTFACTLGPSCYTIVAELPAAEVRGPTVVLARASYVIAGIVIGQLVPRMMVQWGWGAKSAFFFLGADVLGATYCYFRLPESRGLTFGQLDVLFHNRVPARMFSTAKVDEFEGEVAANIVPPQDDEKSQRTVSHREAV